MIYFGTENETARGRWVKSTLEKIPPGKKILDAGAGEAPYKKYCSHLIYVSQDFGKYDGKGNMVGQQMGSWNPPPLDIVSDIISIPQPSRSFDAIICTEVLEHIPEPLLALKEFNRLLKPGGRLILTAPFCSFTHFAPYFHYSGFSRYFFEKHLPRLGFKINKITPNGNYFSFLAQELHRVPGVGKKYGGSRMSKIEANARDRILRMLRRFSKRDTGSWEFCTFGYHVYAIKNAAKA